ncbi:MAG: hypothetical protein J6K62_06840 [Clostridia bacterium]|nr:hypothetical protein [Clostridia bacterium]
MKKLFFLVLCLVLIFAFTACSDNGNAPANNTSDTSLKTTVGNGGETAVNDENQAPANSGAVNQPEKQKVYVVKTFLAVEGAVIYNQTYDEYGYPDCCYFHKKCEACGDVSNNNGSARGNITSSYYCPKCKTSNRVEIEAVSEWIEVYK